MRENHHTKGEGQLIKRNVYATRKDENGVITHLCNSGEWWSPRSKADVVSDIKSGNYEYWAVGTNGKKARIHVYAGEHLRTDPDEADGNNLDELPDC